SPRKLRSTPRNSTSCCKARLIWASTSLGGKLTNEADRSPRRVSKRTRSWSPSSKATRSSPLTSSGGGTTPVGTEVRLIVGPLRLMGLAGRHGAAADQGTRRQQQRRLGQGVAGGELGELQPARGGDRRVEDRLEFATSSGRAR